MSVHGDFGRIGRMLKKPVLFAQALPDALDITEQHSDALGMDITLVRDIRGRIRPLFASRNDESATAVKNYLHELARSLGKYAYPENAGPLFIDEIDLPEEYLAQRILLRHNEKQSIYLLDRQIVGQDWIRTTIQRTTTNPRATFFSVKGGVGRSTAAIHFAWHLAEQGKKVLLFDLDLESPGISNTLLSEDHLPEYGIVDWFVENAVGQSGLITERMVASSPLSASSPGDIRVVPAYGADAGGVGAEYMAKLSRCYAELDSDAFVPWAQRLAALVSEIEESEKPDITLFDSRAGINDIAAALITRLDADVFLFSSNTAQTWRAYQFLFSTWENHPEREKIRQRLKMVWSMIPKPQPLPDSYLQNSWDIFLKSFYDEVAPGKDEGFSYNLTNTEGPHFPLQILWDSSLVEFSLFSNGNCRIQQPAADSAYGKFYSGAWDFIAVNDDGDESGGV